MAVEFRKSLSYPIALFFLFIIALAVLAFFVAPQLSPLFPTDERPKIIGLLEGVSTGFIQHRLALIGTSLAVLGGILIGGREPYLRTRAAIFARHLPWIGRHLRAADAATLAEIWSAYLAAGYGLDRALRSSVNIAPVALRGAITMTAERLREGESFGDLVSSFPGLPVLFSRAVRIGLESGQLSKSLVQCGQHIQSKSLSDLRRELAIAAPVLIATIAGVTAFLMASLLNALGDLGMAG